MRQHIINGNSFNGNSSFGSHSAIVAGRDVRTLSPQSGKRLIGSVVPVVKVRPVMPDISMRERGHERCDCRYQPAACTSLAWPQTAIELPAVAWAALVIQRAQSA
jgi:hypothetical protein